MPKKRIEEVKITKELGISFINSLMNVASHEWPRVIYCFMLKFFVDTGKVIGHTILLSMVAVRLGIEHLPIVLVISGVLIMISTSFFSRLLYRIDKKYLLIILALLSSGMLLISRFILGISNLAHASGGHIVAEAAPINFETILFFSFFLIAEAMLFVQLEIILALYIEGYFTPLESHRTFPIIESAPIFAGIVGGSMFTFLHIYTPDYIFVWAGLLIMTVLSIVVYNYLTDRISIFKFSSNHNSKSHKGIMNDLKKNVLILKKFPYIKNMAIVTILLFAIFKILEFEYTRALLMATGGERELTHGLGAYLLIFSLAALFIQFFMSSRLIKNSGIINSMILNPLFSLLSFFMMLFFFHPAFVIGGKFMFDATNVIYKNAYLSSFYAIAHKIRERVKALIDGWVSPFGIIVGTSLAFFVQSMFPDKTADVILRIILVLFSTIVVVIMFKQKKHYTLTAVRNLSQKDIHERFNAIEILGEQGHIDNMAIMITKLREWSQNIKMDREKIKILETFGRLKDEKTIPVIIDCFMDSKSNVKRAAVNTLSSFENLGRHFYTQTFARYRIINALKHLFETENSRKIKSAIIKVFANLNQLEVVPFLLKVLEDSNDEIKADCIYVIGKFHDPNISYYLKPLLEDENPLVRANAIIALWQFKEMRLDLLYDLTKMLDEGTSNKDILLSGIYATGELKAKQEEKKLLELVKSDDEDVRRHCAIALAKIGNPKAISYILDMIINGSNELALKVKKMFKNINKDFQNKIQHSIEHQISLKINSILEKYKSYDESMDLEDLKTMLHCYTLVDEEKEALNVEHLIEIKNKNI